MSPTTWPAITTGSMSPPAARDRRPRSKPARAATTSRGAQGTTMELVLIGLSGSGKTTLARALARRAGAEAIDLDVEIERRAGRSVSEIFATDGEPIFRALEAAAIADLRPPAGAADDGRLRRVIAAGGGAVVDPAGRWRLFEGRRVVWLDAPVDVLAGRLEAPGASGGQRPLLAGGAAEGLAALSTSRAR